jgi:hypothetical protein
MFRLFRLLSLVFCDDCDLDGLPFTNIIAKVFFHNKVMLFAVFVLMGIKSAYGYIIELPTAFSQYC